MSGESHDEVCPCCGGDMECSSDWKPISCVAGECLDCGFKYWTQTGRSKLSEVNERRADFNRRPLKKLRKQKRSWKII